MKSGSFQSVAAIVALTALLCGCASTAQNDTPSESAAVRAERIASESRALGEKMLDAYIAGDGDNFAALLSNDVRRNFGAEEFTENRAAMEETIGSAQSYEFLTGLDAPVFRTYLWKVRFIRKAQLDGEKQYSQETVFRIVTADLDGKPCLISFGFL
ncbi:MAG: hypothetical protein PHI85_06470 [Victivallaceae bacterium]|nr:hypothetical protein [Victivallaceae bacterium]